MSATGNFVHINLNIICMKVTDSLTMAQERRLKQNRNPGNTKLHRTSQNATFLIRKMLYWVRALCAAAMDSARIEWGNAGKFLQPYALQRFNVLAEIFGFSFLSSKLILKSRGKWKTCLCQWQKKSSTFMSREYFNWFFFTYFRATKGILNLFFKKSNFQVYH